MENILGAIKEWMNHGTKRSYVYTEENGKAKRDTCRFVMEGDNI